MSNLHIYSGNGGSSGPGAISNSAVANNDRRRFPIVKLGSMNNGNTSTGSALSSASGQKVSGNRYDGSNNSPAMFKYSQIFQRKSASGTTTGGSVSTSSHSQYGHPYHNHHHHHHHQQYQSSRNHDLPVYVDRISSIQALRRSLFQPDSETTINGGSAVDGARVSRGVGFERSNSCQSSGETMKPKSILKQRRRPEISKPEVSRSDRQADTLQQPLQQSAPQHRQSTGKHERSVHFALPNANRCRTLRKFVCF